MRRGRRVMVVAGNTEARRDHADLVLQALHGVATYIKLIELPGLHDGGDVSDWLAAGGTIPDLLSMTQITQVWSPPFSVSIPNSAQLTFRASSPIESARYVSAADIRTETDAIISLRAQTLVAERISQPTWREARAVAAAYARGAIEARLEHVARRLGPLFCRERWSLSNRAE